MTTTNILGGGAAQAEVEHIVFSAAKKRNKFSTKKENLAVGKVIYGHFSERLYTSHHALANCPDDAYSFIADPLYRAFIDDIGCVCVGEYGARQRRSVEIIRYEKFIRENYIDICYGKLDQAVAGSKFSGENIDQIRNPLHRLYLNMEVISGKYIDPLRSVDAVASIFLLLEQFTVKFYTQLDYTPPQKCPVFALPLAPKKAKAVHHG